MKLRELFESGIMNGDNKYTIDGNYVTLQNCVYSGEVEEKFLDLEVHENGVEHNQDSILISIDCDDTFIQSNDIINDLDLFQDVETLDKESEFLTNLMEELNGLHLENHNNLLVVWREDYNIDFNGMQIVHTFECANYDVLLIVDEMSK